MHPSEVPTITIDDIPSDAVLLDCREDEEWAAGHIDGALHVPMNLLPQRLNYEPGPLTPETTVVVVCKMGGRSAYVAAWLNGNGFDAVNLDGGMLAWAHAGRPMVNERGERPFVA
ncbi:MAG TPA: rhodanese-like domain-containing protein [Jatrophihabitantaceae bacterium]|nr:rhodanese-like domain-containing protein [Jatrophihabitantaceae bacterium]